MKAPSSFPTVEPLESRIAPAQIFVGASGTPGPESPKDTEYNETNPFDPRAPLFVKTDPASNPTDAISLAVGGNANTYYIKLHAGDELFQFFIGSGYQSVIKVTKGTLIAFFVDKTTAEGGITNEVESGELKGIALGANVSAVIKTPVDGDIVTIYDDKLDKLTLDPLTHQGSLLGPKQGIGNLSVASVNGNIFSGGAIGKLAVEGSVKQIGTGLAASGKAIDLFRSVVGGEGTLTITAAIGEAGPSISNVRVGTLDSLTAGDGGVGGRGGSVGGIEVLQDTDGFTIRAGNGGAGGATKLNGGPGGAVGSVFVSGFNDVTTNGNIRIISGDGGDGAPPPGGGLPGGNGGGAGKLTNVFVGFDSVAHKPKPSSGVLQDNVQLLSGNGGDGRVGGAGGLLSSVKVEVSTPDSFGIVDEIVVRAGIGGEGTALGAGGGGVGGSVTKAIINNRAIGSFGSDILIQAGAGGVMNVPAPGKGAAGGSIANVTLLGYNARVLAGDGSNGSSGGHGGKLSNIKLPVDEEILVQTLVVEAGKGGNAAKGASGNGGSINLLTVGNSDLASLTINAAGGGNGGTGAKGRGGFGGPVSNVNITDSSATGFGAAGAFVLRAGRGGDGSTGGGKGGSLTKTDFFGFDVSVDVAAGAGGSALVEGNGGAGGGTTLLNLTSDGLVNGLVVNGKLQAGQGGNAAGKGAGGAGGDIHVANFDVAGSVQLIAGDGGNGTALGGAGGRGGSLFAVGGVGHDGAGLLQAGNAGLLGGKAANGGRILGGSAARPTVLRSTTDLHVLAGDGSNGGSGGDISGLAFGSTEDLLFPGPTGDILISSGDGSGLGKVAGRGGNILNLNGNPGSGAGKFTRILAGDGGAVATKGATGGSITNLALIGGGDDRGFDNLGNLLTDTPANPVTLIVEAGDAGDATTGKIGARGGSVRGFGANNLDPDLTLRSVAAGDGGDADPLTGRGGPGGTLDNIRVLGGFLRDPVTNVILTDVATGAPITLSADIGVRSGQSFGYATMGGLFAGAGGGGAPGKSGLAGNVTNVYADAIAAIVAGKSATPQLVEKVEKITLSALNHPKTSGNSRFTVSFGGITSATLSGNASPDALETEINSLGVAVPDVDVIRTQTATFQITNRVVGNIAQFTAEENVHADVTEQFSGQQLFTAQETTTGSTIAKEMQYFKPFTSGTYVLDYQNDGGTNPIAFNASAATVAARLNLLQTIIDAGGVTVNGNPVSGFSINFTNIGVRDAVEGVADVKEIQVIDVLGVGGFEIQGNIQDIQGNLLRTVRLPANATAAQVQTALSPVITGGVTVAAGTNSSYIVTFNNAGDQNPLDSTEFIPMIAATTVPGTGTKAETQTLSFAPRNTFTALAFAQANLLGAIVDPNEIGSPVFHFTPVGAAHVGFRLGDQPIDGLVMARIFNQGTANFTPEAKFVTTEKGKPLTLSNTVEETRGTATVAEIQSFKNDAHSDFTLNFGGLQTAVLAALAPAATVEAALNSLSSITSAGGVTVALAAGQYTITFLTPGNRLPVAVQYTPFFDNDNLL